MFRYNRNVDKTTQIFLNSFPGDIEGLIAALGKIPYNGSGMLSQYILVFVYAVNFEALLCALAGVGSYGHHPEFEH